MLLQVESRPGLHGDKEPLAFMLGGLRIVVLQIVDRWISEDTSYFRIEANDQNRYILRYTPSSSEWELTLFQSHEMRPTS